MELFLSKLQAMIEVLYYYYYLFYKNIWKDNDPHLTTILSLSFLISLIVNGIVDITVALIFSVFWDVYLRIGILLVIIILMHYYFRKERVKDILKRKPIIYNQSVSKIMSIVFLLVGLFFHFFNPFIVKHILDLNQ